MPSEMPLTILWVKIGLAILSFLIGAALVWLGVSLIRNHNGTASRALSKFKFWGIDVSSPSGGLVVVVVSIAWALVGARVMPGLRYEEGPWKITMMDLTKPIADTVAVMKAPDGKKEPVAGEILSKFEVLAKKKYKNDPNATIVADVAVEEQKPVFKLRASSGTKTIEERYTAELKNGSVEFTPFGVSAEDTNFQAPSLKFDCAFSIEAFFRKVKETPDRQDIETHRKALNGFCPNEIHQLPADKRLIFEKTNE